MLADIDSPLVEDETPAEWLALELETEISRCEASGELSTYVLPLPTNVVEGERPISGEVKKSTTPDSSNYRFRTPQHREALALTLDVLKSQHRHHQRAHRLAGCGSYATVWHSQSTDSISIRAFHCGLRCCPRCRETHSAQTRERLGRFLAATDTTKLSMITLTLAHTAAPLAEQIDRLYRSFRKLRASKLWRTYRPKGYAVCEVSRSADGLAWHPHLHLLASTPYIPVDALRAAWLTATSDSHIVDIRRINRHAIERHRDYLCDYLTKPPAEDVLHSPTLLLEWIDAHSARHVLIKFGRPNLADKPLPPTEPTDWRLIGRLECLIAAMNAGDADATHWLMRIGHGRTTERRDRDAGKDYGSDMAFRTDTKQFL